HKVPAAFDKALVDEIWEACPLTGADGSRWSAESVVGAVQQNRRHRDRRPLGECPLHLEKPTLTGGVEVAMAIGMDHAVNEVGILEGGRGERVHLVAELPRRRPFA